MIGCGAILKLNLFFLISGDTPIYSPILKFNCSHIHNNRTHCTLKLINVTRSKIFGNPILEMKDAAYSGLILKDCLQFTKIKNIFQ